MKFLSNLLIILQLINGLMATISELNNCKRKRIKFLTAIDN